MATGYGTTAPRPITDDEKRVIFASSLGTVFEWYDFYLFAVLAIFFTDKFYPPGNPTVALLASLATLAAGFLAATKALPDGDFNAWLVSDPDTQAHWYAEFVPRAINATTNAETKKQRCL